MIARRKRQRDLVARLGDIEAAHCGVTVADARGGRRIVGIRSLRAVEGFEGKANVAVIALVAAGLGLAASRLRMLRGATSREKLLQIGD